ncbi:uncharacterized protein LOC132088022 [Daphnia carinata]|uniref:uncharacterized protein LOC132088022 n=1 Tax=Daphnia carinata TaxID=120202 RepID=UPI0028697E1A|nr:uncharacterized protein LOC132088022 [Daphnia carinata]
MTSTSVEIYNRFTRLSSDMKFALAVLLSLVVISNQQFHQQPTNDKLLWLLTYYSPQPTFRKYNYLLPNYDVSEDGRPLPFFKQLTTSSISPIYSQDKEPYLNAIQNPKALQDNQFPDIELRNKLDNSRYGPSFLQQTKPQFDPRVVINVASRTNLLNRVKTITVTFVSSVTFTSVQSCIPSTEFYPGATAVTCRRKRRELYESPDDHSEAIQQFAISPSNVQPMEPTVLSSVDPIAVKPGDNGTFNHGIASSKEEDTLGGWPSVTSRPLGYFRGERLFFHLVTTTTAISYTFLSTTVTKTVNLLYPYFGGQLVCLPQGYAVCPYVAQYYG